MGRKKIDIARISEERSRQITFSKRKHGLLKKAYELSILCGVDVAVIIIGSNQKLYQYGSSNINEILMKYTEIQEPYENKSNADVHEDIVKRNNKHGSAQSPDEDGDDNYINAHDVDFPPRPHYQMPQVKPHLGIGPVGVHPTGVPQAMPVAVPVSSSSPKVAPSSSEGSTSSSSGGEASQNFKSVPSDLGVHMPPPKPITQTPPRLQAFKNPALKLHLPGGGTIKLNSAEAQKSSGSNPSTVGEALAEIGNEGTEKRPKLSVVTPGMKEYSPRPNVPSNMLSPSVLSSLINTGQGQFDSSGNFTIPISLDSVNTPGINLATPGLASLLQDINAVPSASATAGEALLTFPLNFQNLQTSSGSGTLKFGPPILVTPQPSSLDVPPSFHAPNQHLMEAEKSEVPTDTGVHLFKRQQSLEMVQQILQLHQQYMQQQDQVQGSNPHSESISQAQILHRHEEREEAPKAKRSRPSSP